MNQNNDNQMIHGRVHHHTKELLPVLLLLISVSVLFLGYQTVIDPLFSVYMSRQQSYKAQLAANNSLLEQESYYRQSNVAEVSKNDDQLLHLALPEKLDLPSIVIQLSALCAQQGMELKNIEKIEASKDQFTAANPDLRSSDLRLAVKGDYAQLKSLVSGLGDSVINLQVIDFKYDPQSGGIVTVRTYYLK